MSRLTIPDQSQAPKESQEILSEIGQMLGFVPNIQRVMARSPHVLEGWWSLRKSLFKTLDANTRHAVALGASEVNGCNYCLAVHSQMAAKVGQLSSGEITRLREGKSSDPKRAAAAQFARQVVAKRGKVSDDDLASVKAAGFREENIIEIVAEVIITMFTNLINNVVDTDIDFIPVTPSKDEFASCSI